MKKARTPRRSGATQGRKKTGRPSRTSKVRQKTKPVAKKTTYSKSFPPQRPPIQTYKVQDMSQIFRVCGISLTQEKELKIWHHYRLLTAWNQIHNFTRIRDFKEIMIKHFVDSFMVAKLIELPESLLDIGTGPGFPGIPIKVIRPEIHMILAERIQKRVLFLNEVKKRLGLTDLEIIGRRIDKNFSVPVHGVITRAFASIAETLPKVAGCLLPGGVVIFMKGPSVDEEIKKAQRIIEGRYILEKDIAYTLPIKGHKRRLVIFRRLCNEENLTASVTGPDNS